MKKNRKKRKRKRKKKLMTRRIKRRKVLDMQVTTLVKTKDGTQANII
jgi:hypothetical protein